MILQGEGKVTPGPETGVCFLSSRKSKKASMAGQMKRGKG